MRRISAVPVDTNVAGDLGCGDRVGSAGGGPLDLRPGSALLWRAPDAQSEKCISPGSSAVVVAFRPDKDKNPFAGSPELLQESSRHFADHCASCHANDGSGNTEMGRNLNPPAPDMRLQLPSNSPMASSTTSFTTGCAGPACPPGGKPGRRRPDSWKLVWFIRHLPI